jgi:hypothetical protein
VQSGLAILDRIDSRSASRSAARARPSARQRPLARTIRGDSHPHPTPPIHSFRTTRERRISSKPGTGDSAALLGLKVLRGRGELVGFNVNGVALLERIRSEQPRMRRPTHLAAEFTRPPSTDLFAGQSQSPG